MRQLLKTISIDLRGLATLRILTGSFVILDLFLRINDLSCFYSDEGVIPRSFLLAHSKNPEYIYSLNLCSGRVEVQAIFLIANICLALGMVMGYKTLFSSFFTYLLYTSFKLRNMYVLDVGHDMLNILLFWQLFLPTGKMWSLDSLRTSQKPSSTSYTSIGTFAYILQLCIIYFSQSFNKTDASWTDDFTALYYTLHLDQFCSPLGKWLLHYPSVTKVLTAVTIYIQSYAFYLIYIPLKQPFWRTLTIIIFVGFHLSTALFLHLGLLPYIFIIAWLPLLPPNIWDNVSSRLLTGKTFEALKKTLPTLTPLHPAPFTTSPLLGQFLAGLCIVLVTHSTLRTNYNHQLTLSGRDDELKKEWFTHIRRGLGIKTKWTMFSPAPPIHNTWYMLVGIKANGEAIDLMRNSQPVSFKKPDLQEYYTRNIRWNNFIYSLRNPAKSELYAAYAFYMLKLHENSAQVKGRIKKLKFIMVRQKTPPIDSPDRRTKIVEKTLWDRSI